MGEMRRMGQMRRRGKMRVMRSRSLSRESWLMDSSMSDDREPAGDQAAAAATERSETAPAACSALALTESQRSAVFFSVSGRLLEPPRCFVYSPSLGWQLHTVRPLLHKLCTLPLFVASQKLLLALSHLVIII
jgi:hypothetical protein